ncbi:MAG: PRC-barrel domain-containing protein [Dysgonamonadaceae bacterium]|nr:PRC-barrel domain-containing protein [Dysgonamonadaceae bacterium]MDD4727679.1 PRC-barrel domain-containing protein [Dysgonamonadaceae bacterium]
MLFKTKTLESYKLEGKEGELGRVKEFYFDDKYWTIRYLVADTGNWLTGRQVLISPYALVGINEEDKDIVVNLNEKQIEDSPSLDSDKPVSRQFERSYSDYFEFPEYWHGRLMWGAYPYIMRDFKQTKQAIAQEKDSWDPHLRSTKDVTGHDIQATDGEIGHVEDFIIDDATWAIRYLVIDTKKWWGGKKVLISPQWIDRISWDESKVFVNLSRESIKQSPEYTDDFLLTRDYEDQLHHHYKRKGYWIDE